MARRSRENIAIERLKTFEPKAGYYLAFSGGKDSCVIKHLADLAGVQYDAHYNFTTCDPPELVKFIKQSHPEVEFGYPPRTLWQLIVDNALPPTRLIRYCCKALKEAGGQHRTIITGVRKAEGVMRNKQGQLVRYCNKFKKFVVNPIIDWPDTAVWAFIKKHKLPYCSLYDEGFKRLGCIGCPMGGKQRRVQFDRWPLFERAWRNSITKAWKARQERGMPCEDHFKSPESMWTWWMEEE